MNAASPSWTRRGACALLSALAGLAASAAPAPARTIDWSGYTWDIRADDGAQPTSPGPNYWSDSPANVSVDGTDLVLATAKDSQGRWASAEIQGRQSLGYGTYRWVVKSDLSALDADEVLGMFTYGGSDPSNNEIDIEPSHWGNLAWDTGSATVWQDAAHDLSQARTFRYTSRPPYVNQFTWRPGAITYLITDAAGTTLLDWTVTSGVPVPGGELPLINYWRFAGRAPASARSVRLAAFSWTPLAADGTGTGTGIGTGTAPRSDPPAPTARSPRLRLRARVKGRTITITPAHAKGAAGRVTVTAKPAGRPRTTLHPRHTRSGGVTRYVFTAKRGAYAVRAAWAGRDAWADQTVTRTVRVR